MGGQKIKCVNHIKWEPIIRQIIRKFQIWPQNLNRITFYPLFGHKSVENMDIFKNPYFRQFFGQQRGQILSDLNSTAKFGIL